MTNWTDQQQAILDAWENTQDNIIIGALAGTGKSTVLAEAMTRNDAVGIYFAFMNKNVDDMAPRLENTPHICSTLNSYGNKLMRSYIKHQLGMKMQRIDKWKYLKIAKNVLENYAPSSEVLDNWGFEMMDIVSKVRAYMTDPTDHDAVTILTERFDFDFGDKPWFFDCVERMIEIGKNQIMAGVLDFDDQIWGPLILGIKPSETYDAVYVDECQDLTVAKMRLAMLACTPGTGRIMLAGDHRQAIFGFAGADTDSYKMTKDMAKAVEFPMTNSWRFGDTIADYSRDIVPALVGKSPTSLDVVMHKRMIPRTVNEDVAIIARTNAELVALAVTMLRAGIPAHMKNQRLGKDMLRNYDNFNQSSDYAWENFPISMYEYRLQETEAMREKGVSKRRIGMFEDALDCLTIAYEKSGASDKAAFRKEIEMIFKKTDGAYLTTAHSAKGGQWTCVYVINPQKFRDLATNHRTKILQGKATEESYWIATQELNALYVAQTRAQDELYLLPEYYAVEGYNDDALAMAKPITETDVIMKAITTGEALLDEAEATGD